VRGSTFTDTLGNTYRVGKDDCGITLVGSRPATCSYNDAGDGHKITAVRGSTFTDTLGNTYQVGDDCRLQHV
jgi:hypothetical protein